MCVCVCVCRGVFRHLLLVRTCFFTEVKVSVLRGSFDKDQKCLFGDHRVWFGVVGCGSERCWVLPKAVWVVCMCCDVCVSMWDSHELM